MTAKTFLSQYRDTERLLRGRLIQLRRLRETALSVARALSPDHTEYAPFLAGGETMEEIKRMERDADAQLSRLISLESEIEAAIRALPDIRQQEVLRLRYLSGMTWNEICEELYGRRHDYTEKFDSYLRGIYRSHAKALLWVEESWNAARGA